MATTVEYLPFATGTGNEVTTQVAYTAADWRIRGFTSGILPHEYINKALRQATVPGAALAQTIADLLQIDVLDDGDIAGFVTKLKLAFSANLPYVPGSSPPGSIGKALDNINSSGGSGVNADLLRDLLANGLNEDQFTVTLKNRLNLIDTPTTGLVAKTDALVATYGSTAAAATSAAGAAQSRADAIAAQNAAAISQGAAFTSAQTASSSAQTATTAAGSATTSANQAASSASGAAGSANSAHTDMLTAATSAQTATDRATAAATSATNAASSAGAAGTSATASSNSATNANTSAGNAQTFAGQASTSATSAAGSATTATNRALVATNAADAAAGSASAAAGSAQTATTAASSAGTSATASSNSATAAATSASSASTFAGQASTSATNAAGSAGTASTQASAAVTAANTAGNSATAANTSASNAAASAGNAGNSANAAAQYYQQTVSATGNLTASVTALAQTTASSVDGLNNRLTTTEANYVLKVGATRTDGKQVISGIGFASTAVGNVGQSEILLQADKLVFVPSSDPNAQLTNLLVVQTINGVATLFVPQALIPELSAKKITTGSFRGVNLASGAMMTRGSFLTATVANNAPVLPLDNTDDFPTSGVGVFVGGLYDRSTFTWTGKTATTLTGCNGVTPQATVGITVIPRTTQAMVIDDAVNEMRFFGNRGDGSIRELANIGVNSPTGEQIIMTLGSDSQFAGSTRLPLFTQTGNQSSIYAVNNSASPTTSAVNVGDGTAVQGNTASAQYYGGFFTNSTGTGMAGQSNGSGIGAWGISASGNGVQGQSTTGHGGSFQGNATRSHLLLPPLAAPPTIRTAGSVAMLYTNGGTVGNRINSPRLFYADGTNWRYVNGDALFGG